MQRETDYFFSLMFNVPLFIFFVTVQWASLARRQNNQHIYCGLDRKEEETLNQMRLKRTKLVVIETVVSIIK